MAYGYQSLSTCNGMPSTLEAATMATRCKKNGVQHLVQSDARALRALRTKSDPFFVACSGGLSALFGVSVALGALPT